MSSDHMHSVESCFVSKLTKDFEEYEDNKVDWRIANWDHHSENTLELFNKNTDLSLELASILLIFVKELQTDGPWNSKKHKAFALKINKKILDVYGTTLENLLKKNNIIKSDNLFDKCMEILHLKLTQNEFRKYPSLVEVYCLLTKNIKDYDVTLIPQKVLPISLLLINDCNNGNKMKGLQCCLNVLQCMSDIHFQNGNYYEVIHSTLMNTATDPTVKELKLTKMTHQCFLELLKVLPSNVKIHKTECVFTNTLNQLCTESNLYTKATHFQFAKDLITVLGINAVKKKKIFLTIVYDSLDVCEDEPVWKILLFDLLECLEEWLKYCWCSWKLQSDQKLLSKLIKLMYVTTSDKNMHAKIVRIVTTLITLCSHSERKQILSSFHNYKRKPVFQNIVLFSNW